MAAMAGNASSAAAAAAEAPVLAAWQRGLGLDWRAVVVTLILAYIAYEQLALLRKRKWLPGPLVVLPFIGSIVTMINDPTKYWDDQAREAKQTGLSWNSLIGNYIVFIRDTELSHKVFANVRRDGFLLIGHPLGKALFGEHNMITMMGDVHKELRRRLAPLFTFKALGLYINIQEKCIRSHIDKWLDQASITTGPVSMRIPLRDMNLETSQTVFVGPYLTPEVRARFTLDYHLFNTGLLALPINLPGCAFWKATRAVQRIIATLADCAGQSKRHMATGAEPACLMDFWMVETVKEMREAEAAGQPAPPHSSDWDVGQHLFDFLFAAQDASTSSLVWVFTLLDGHPEVLKRVREEVLQHHPDPAAPYSPEVLRQLTYTEQVMKEVLRFRPPATMVPHIAAVDYPLTPDYTVPKGTIVFPSLLESSFQGFKDPYNFDPDRFSPERREDQVYKRNWLLFGAGPHQCLGQRYAMNHIMLFMALLVSQCHWKRELTPDCDRLIYVPTICPKDGALVHLSSALP